MLQYNENSPIGFFDSGVGGLSVYARFVNLLPYENTIYFGDLKNMPYGNKSKDELLMFARNILDFFATKNVKAVVIACNTSSAIAYNEIKNEYNFKIYPIIQSIAKVLAKQNYNNIGVFATNATINSHAYKIELQNYNKNINVIEIACPNWVKFVENNALESEECISDIKIQLNSMLKYSPEKIILGCTHYPYLLDNLSKFVKKETFIDPAEIFVEFIKNDLANNKLINSNNKIKKEEFFVSAKAQEFVKNAKLFYDVKNIPIIV